MIVAHGPFPGSVGIERERSLPFATAHIAHFEISEPCETVMPAADVFRLDMCLTPRPAGVRARYRDHWTAHRFEPVGGVYLLPPGHALEVRCVAGVTTSLVCELRAQQVSERLGVDIHVIAADASPVAVVAKKSPRAATTTRRK